MEPFEQRFREFIKARYKYQKRLADEIGMSKGQLNDYVTGKREPGLGVLRKLTEAGLNVVWLMTGRGTMDIQELPEAHGILGPPEIYVKEGDRYIKYERSGDDATQHDTGTKSEEDE